MQNLFKILIVDNDDNLSTKLNKLIANPKIFVHTSNLIPKNTVYNIYIIGIDLTNSLKKIQNINNNVSIYLFDFVCRENVSIKNVINCNISGCLENNQDLDNFAKKVNSLYKQQNKMYEVSSKLDNLVTLGRASPAASY